MKSPLKRTIDVKHMTLYISKKRKKKTRLELTANNSVRGLCYLELNAKIKGTLEN